MAQASHCPPPTQKPPRALTPPGGYRATGLEAHRGAYRDMLAADDADHDDPGFGGDRPGGYWLGSGGFLRLDRYHGVAAVIAVRDDPGADTAIGRAQFYLFRPDQHRDSAVG